MVRVKVHAIAGVGEVMLPHRLLKENLTAPSGQISFGLVQQAVRFRKGSSDGKPAPLGLSADVLQALGLHNGAVIWASWHPEEQRLRLGPVIAVFVSHSRSPGSAFFMGSATDMVRTFIRLARRRGVKAYAFSPKDINWETKMVNGYVPAGRHWRRVMLPLPDVVYDRVQSRSIDRIRRFRETRQRLLETPGLHYFNPCFLDKWETYQALSQDQRARRYLPKTDRLTHPSQLAKFLKAYANVYIKPSRGSLGIGITKITRTGNGYRYHRIREKTSNNVGVLDSFGKLEKKLSVILPKQQLIIQQGLRLARYQGRPYDIRVIVQKTPKGRWSCTTMIARVAPAAGSAVSNVAEGGTMIPVSRAIRGSLRIGSRRAVGRVGAGARIIARAVEEQFGKEFGEFGIDMAFDVRGRLWLIEVNAKPGRQNDYSGTPPSMRRVVRYAISKAGF